jgi:pullulanase
MLFNGNNYSVELDIPQADWLVIAEDGEINPNGMGRVSTQKVRIHPTSMMILVMES